MPLYMWNFEAWNESSENRKKYSMKVYAEDLHMAKKMAYNVELPKYQFYQSYVTPYYYKNTPYIYTNLDELIKNHPPYITNGLAIVDEVENIELYQ